MSRQDDIGQAYLRWQYSHDRQQPTWINFLNDPTSLVNGQQVEQDELHEAVARLTAHHLIDGPRIWGRGGDVPVRVRLTDEGRICVADYNADIRRWSDRNTARIDQSVTVNAGHDAQVAAHSQNLNQSQVSDLVDVNKLRLAATAALEALPAFALTEKERAAMEQAAREIIVEADKAASDHGKLRALAEKIKTWLPLATSGATLATMIANDINRALH